MHEATEKARLSLQDQKSNLKVKIDALKQSAEDQKHNYEDIIGNMRVQHEEQIATMGEVSTIFLFLSLLCCVES